MSAIYTRWGPASWIQVGNGKAYSRWGGGWFPAKLLRAKVGAVGAGYWQDSGFTGQPAGPSVPWVVAWDYTNCIFAWNAGGGGEPIDHYEYVLARDSDGGWVAHANTTATSVMIGINWDTRYRFYVQAVGINGVATGWSEGTGSTIYGHPGIGHPRQDTYGMVWHSTPWQSEVQWNIRWRDDPWWVYVTNDIHLTSLNWSGLRTDMSSVVSIGTNRVLYAFLDGHDEAPLNYHLPGNAQILSSSSYSSYGIPLDNFGDNQTWGVVPRGSGWDPPGGNSSRACWADAVQLVGDRFYQTNDLVSSIAEAGNYWW